MTEIETDLSPVYRSKKLLAALKELYDDSDPDPAASLTDLLTDARHFADAYGLDYGEHDRAAHSQYYSELGWSRTRAPAPNITTSSD